jgi:hypothetical protein
MRLDFPKNIEIALQDNFFDALKYLSEYFREDETHSFTYPIYRP